MKIEVPILLITFNRPDHVRRVLTEIRKQQPMQLFVCQDGARDGNESDKAECQEVRAVVKELVDWPCELHTLYQEKNLGCGPGPAAGITWFFEHVEAGLIFEDDAVPHPDFFEYAATLLEKYKDDESVRAIGSMKLFDEQFGGGSYYFSMMNRTLCAWATWRRAWKYFDYEMKDYTREDLDKAMKQYGATLREREYWMNRLDEIHKDCLRGSSWDQQFWMTIWLTGGKGICPNSNLSTNIGFDDTATHTFNPNSVGSCRALEPILPMHEPRDISIQRKADLLFHKTYYEPWQYGWEGLKRLPNRIKKRMERQIRNIRWSECLWVLLEMSLMLYPVVLKCKHDHDISFLVSSAIFALPFAALLTIWTNKIWRNTIVLLTAICSAVETTMVVLFGEFILAGNILAAFTTNNNEAAGFASHSMHVLRYFIPIVLIAAGAIFAYTKYAKGKDKWKRNVLFFAISLLFACSFVGYKQLAFYQGKLTMRYYVTNRILNRPPYNIWYQLYNVYQMQRIRRFIALSENFEYGAIKKDTLAQKEIYVLGIGESMNYEHCGLNGTYYRNTTPLLAAEPNVTLFTNYYSAGCLTMWSVPMLLTRATPFDFETNYKEKSVFKAFKEAGFKTFTIAHKDNLLSFEVYLSNGDDGLIRVEHDSIIPHVIDSLAAQYDKLFITFQMIGNHHPYWNFTSEYDVYHPNVYSDPSASSDMLYKNAYDNTYLYADYLLAQIIHRLDRENMVSSFVFVPDHGEEVTSNGGGHGAERLPGKNEYHVPMIVWSSDAWVETYPAKQSHMIAHKDEPVNGDNIIYSLIDMANISIDSTLARPNWSVFADTLEKHERFVLLPDGVNVFKCK